MGAFSLRDARNLLDGTQTGWNDFILLEQTNADGADAGSFLLSEASEELSVFDGQTRPSNTYQTYEEVYSWINIYYFMYRE